MTKMITCKECGKWKPHRALGLCDSCYMRQYRSRRPRVRIGELRARLDSAYEDMVKAFNKILSQFGASCSYENGEIVVEFGGKEYRERI